MRTLFILFASCAVVLGQAFSPNDPHGPDQPVATGGSFTANASTFTFASSQYMDITTSFVATDSGLWTLSFWFKLNGTDGVEQDLLIWDTGGFSKRQQVLRTSANKILLNGFNSAGGGLFSVTSSGTFLSGSGWHHVFLFVDLSSSLNRGLYIDGASDGSAAWGGSYISGNLAFSGMSAFVGAWLDGGFPSDVCLAEVWCGCNQYATDVTKFNVGGHPVSLGTDGSTPTGTAPAYYLKSAFASFGTDSSGHGNNFTIHAGPLTSCTAP